MVVKLLAVAPEGTHRSWGSNSSLTIHASTAAAAHELSMCVNTLSIPSLLRALMKPQSKMYETVMWPREGPAADSTPTRTAATAPVLTACVHITTKPQCSLAYGEPIACCLDAEDCCI